MTILGYAAVIAAFLCSIAAMVIATRLGKHRRPDFPPPRLWLPYPLWELSEDVYEPGVESSVRLGLKMSVASIVFAVLGLVLLATGWLTSASS